MAECSVSTGIRRHPFCFASSVTICPAATKVSLLAIAISFFAFNASIVGSKPETPTTELNTRFVSGWVDTSSKPLVPYVIFVFVYIFYTLPIKFVNI